ncbi:MAG: hypothetical protein AAB353_12645 [Candidatus Hydrogenedentota bacterium]
MNEEPMTPSERIADLIDQLVGAFSTLLTLPVGVVFLVLALFGFDVPGIFSVFGGD